MKIKTALEEVLNRLDVLIDEAVEEMHATLSYHIGMYEAAEETLAHFREGENPRKWAMHMEAKARAQEAEADMGRSMWIAPELLSYFAGRAHMFEAVAEIIKESWDGPEESERDYAPAD